MVNVNLKSVGYDVNVDLEGEVLIRPGKPPLIFLLAESHETNDIIGQNLHNARNLVRAGIVRLVGVEEFVSTADIHAKITEELRRRKVNSIAEYATSMRNDFGGDEGIIEGVKKQANANRMSFARHLLYLLPDLAIVGIEDPDLRMEAQSASENAAKEFMDEPDLAKRQKLQIMTFRSDGVEREQKRDAAFLRLALAAYEERKPDGAILINGGGRHIKRIADHLAQEGKAHVLIVPDGYVDAVE